MRLLDTKVKALFWYYVLAGFGRAAMYKLTKDMARVRLPNLITSDRAWGHAEKLFVKETYRRVDKLVNVLVHFTTRKCFYRAYTSAYILRKYGIVVILNIGLHHLHKKDRGVRGHSWLSREDRPLMEDSDPRVRYNQFLGTGLNGIRYWLGGDKSNKRKIVRYRTAAKGLEKNGALRT